MGYGAERAPMRDDFCSHCGTAFAERTRYPRTCGGCNVKVWANPIPVSVVLVPVQRGDALGLLVIRRAIPPGAGKLALVGGFLEEHETWQEGGSREVREETGAVVDARTLVPFWYASTAPHPSRVLLFSVAEPVTLEQLGPFTPDAETAERGLIFGAGGLDDVFAFALHAEAVRRFFSARGIDREHGHVVV